MNELPQLPAQTSNDGRELWDWAASLSTAIQRQAEIGRLSRELAHLQVKTCGHCEMWMTRGCPREHSTMRGYNEGPHCNVLACKLFEPKQWWLNLIRKRGEELAALLNPSPAAMLGGEGGGGE
jgi:hypothetical protein